MAQGSLYVTNLQGFMRASAIAEKESKTYVRGSFRKVGEIVRIDGTRMFSPIDARSAVGFKTRVRQTGVLVEQSLRKRTGKRGDYGALQMRKALLPSLLSNQDKIEREFERALDKVADHFERGI